ncbi:MAG: DUF3604 domain-containing protein [Myxococcota bacterium]
MSSTRVALGVLAVIALAGLYLAGAQMRLYGRHQGPGKLTESRIPAADLEQRARVQQRAAAALSSAPTREILFGDLHVHTTYSPDAFARSLPMLGGIGAHPIGDACDFARFCSALDFWSINDHAEATTPAKWSETKESIRSCNAVAQDPENPDVAAFIGWEWSQVGIQPEDHYGHKNVIFPGLADGDVPARAIGAAGPATDALRGMAASIPPLLGLLDLPNRQRYYDFAEFFQEFVDLPSCETGVDTRELPVDCYESVATPAELFEKLDQWGFDTIVIPHGNTWGFYSPPGITLDKQLTAAQNDPGKQILFEVMSGHGNSEEYRDFRGGSRAADGSFVCPEPTPDYLPSCWRAGEIIEERCRAAGEDDAECDRRAAEARQNAINIGQAGHWVVPGVQVADWLDAGQCRDCFLPSFNYRPAGSAQYGLAISNFDDPVRKRFRFGFIAASDNHTARPGTGYKEYARRGMTDANGPSSEAWAKRIGRGGEKPEPRSRALAIDTVRSMGLRALEVERQSSFFMTGGLAAVHSDGRSRAAIWQALKRKEVYGTSGDRMLLWFHLLNAERPDGSLGAVPMGGEARMNQAPRFEVRAVGAFEQKPGCPDYSVRALDPERLESLCRGECYNPSDDRKLVTRIEVVRIRPQSRPDELVSTRIEDPWRVFPCNPDPAGCVVQFEDPDFVDASRDTVYYVRAIEEPSPVVNGDPLRCDTDEEGRCVKANPCYGDYRTSRDDDCLTDIEERAWSSPIFVDWAE